MKIPEPGEHSHGKEHKTERNWSQHMKAGGRHLEDHMKETRREVERHAHRDGQAAMKGDR